MNSNHSSDGFLMKKGRIAYFVFKIIGTSSQFCLLVSAGNVKGPIKVQLKGFRKA